MYLQFYGLSEAPFAITPDPAFVYLSQEHRDALAHLLYGVGTGGSGGFVQLTGEVGTGKTTMCRKVLQDWRYVNLENLDTRRYAIEDPRAFLREYNHRVIIDEAAAALLQRAEYYRDVYEGKPDWQR